MDDILFIAGGRLGVAKEGTARFLDSQPLELYRRNVAEINRKNEWKTAGSGARFMYGAAAEAGFDEEESSIGVGGIARIGADTVVYSLNIRQNTGLHIKNIAQTEDPEGYIIRKTDMNIFELDYHGVTRDIVASASYRTSDKHLALFNEKTTDYRFITEGDCHDQNPVWSKENPAVIYYDSRGIAYDQKGVFGGFGPAGIFRLDTKSGELEELIANSSFDCCKPRDDASGNIYYIKKPYRQQGTKNAMNFKDILFMPVKLFKAVFGWLNFFTQRYAGQSLKTSGANPAQTREKTPEEIFIEGNLVNVLKAEKENQKSGEAHPGAVPRDWQLVKRASGGGETVIKQGVLDFCLTEDGDIIYSNGNFIIKLSGSGAESMLAKAKLAVRPA